MTGIHLKRSALRDIGLMRMNTDKECSDGGSIGSNQNEKKVMSSQSHYLFYDDMHLDKLKPYTFPTLKTNTYLLYDR